MSETVSFIQPGPLAQIAWGLRVQLELVFPPQRFDHQWMPPKITRQAWKTLMRRPPFVGVGFDRFFRVQTQNNLAVISEWTVYLAVKNERGQGPLLFGDSLAPGFFTVTEVASSALHGFTIAGLGTVQVTSADNVTIEEDDDPSLGLAAISLTVNADLSVANVLSGALVTPNALTVQSIAWAFDAANQNDTILNTGTA